MSDFIVRVEDHSEEIRRKLEERKEAILEECGQQAATHARNIITRHSRVDTGAMRNDVDYQVSMSESAVYIGTAIEYAIYHEYGTGIYLEGGGGRQTPWRYVDKRGEWHWTRGIKPIHMFKNCLENFKSEYKKIIKDKLKD